MRAFEPCIRLKVAAKGDENEHHRRRVVIDRRSSRKRGIERENERCGRSACNQRVDAGNAIPHFADRISEVWQSYEEIDRDREDEDKVGDRAAGLRLYWEEKGELVPVERPGESHRIHRQESGESQAGQEEDGDPFFPFFPRNRVHQVASVAAETSPMRSPKAGELHFRYRKTALLANVRIGGFDHHHVCCRLSQGDPCFEDTELEANRKAGWKGQAVGTGNWYNIR